MCRVIRTKKAMLAFVLRRGDGEKGEKKTLTFRFFSFPFLLIILHPRRIVPEAIKRRVVWQQQ